MAPQRLTLTSDILEFGDGRRVICGGHGEVDWRRVAEQAQAEGLDVKYVGTETIKIAISRQTDVPDADS